MTGFAAWVQGHQFLLTAFIGAIAWLTGKAWELQTARRARYAEVAALLSQLARGDSGPDSAALRDQLDTALAKLWVEAPTPVVLAGERLRQCLDDAGLCAPAMKGLVIAMRRDTALWAWFSQRRRRQLQPDQIALTSRPHGEAP